LIHAQRSRLATGLRKLSTAPGHGFPLVAQLLAAAIAVKREEEK